MQSAAVATLCSLLVAVVLPASALAQNDRQPDLAWRQAGLTERQAAAHLLNRLTFGPRPGDVDRVVEVGLANWIQGELLGDLPGSFAQSRLAEVVATDLSVQELVLRYSPSHIVLQQAVAAGIVSQADYGGLNGEQRRRAAEAVLRDFAERQGFAGSAEIRRDLVAQKFIRALYSETQLVEVLTDFWFNHFNVSLTNPLCSPYVLSYERDAIRPHVLGSFRGLLRAVARHPAMIQYLGNAASAADPDVWTSFDFTMESLDGLSPASNPTDLVRLARELGWRSPLRRQASPQRSGLNENYARELLELHTLGVDGGYTQEDVIAVARAFTGWTSLPLGAPGERIAALLEQSSSPEEVGFLCENEFLFRPDWHDAEEKVVLGAPLPDRQGIEDGETVLDLVAHHPSTSRHLARKMAVRFVSDFPSSATVDDLAAAYEINDGDLREMVRRLVYLPEFWESRGDKIKSPFEFVVSAMRALDMDVLDPIAVTDWVARMGQPLYAYDAPTGFPDSGASWIQVGPLFYRINFARLLAADRIPGTALASEDLFAGVSLESDQSVVKASFDLLLPEGDWESVAELLGVEPEIEESRLEEKEGEQLPTPEQRQRIERAIGTLIASPLFQRR